MRKSRQTPFQAIIYAHFGECQYINKLWKKFWTGVFLYSLRGSAAASSTILERVLNISQPETITKYK
jgi:hypothetical protein